MPGPIRNAPCVQCCGAGMRSRKLVVNAHDGATHLAVVQDQGGPGQPNMTHTVSSCFGFADAGVQSRSTISTIDGQQTMARQPQACASCLLHWPRDRHPRGRGCSHPPAWQRPASGALHGSIHVDIGSRRRPRCADSRRVCMLVALRGDFAKH